ncbi:hypothetical protein QEN19_001680 [Hanseniaspora menglaensis]
MEQPDKPMRSYLPLYFLLSLFALFSHIKATEVTVTSASIVRTQSNNEPRTALTTTTSVIGADAITTIIVIPEVIAIFSETSSTILTQISGITQSSLISTDVIINTVDSFTIVYETLYYIAVQPTTTLTEETLIYMTSYVNFCPTCFLDTTSSIELIEVYTAYTSWTGTTTNTYSTFITSTPGTKITTYYVETPVFNGTSYTTNGWTGAYATTYSTSEFVTVGDDGYSTYSTIYYVETPDNDVTSYATTSWHGSYATTYSTFTTQIVTNDSTVDSTLYYVKTPVFNGTSYTTNGWTGAYATTYSTSEFVTVGDDGYSTYSTIYYVETPDNDVTSYITTSWHGSYATTYSTFTTQIVTNDSTVDSTLYYVKTPVFNGTSYTTNGWTGAYATTYSTSEFVTVGDDGYSTYSTIYYVETPRLHKLNITNTISPPIYYNTTAVLSVSKGIFKTSKVQTLISSTKIVLSCYTNEAEKMSSSSSFWKKPTTTDFDTVINSTYTSFTTISSDPKPYTLNVTNISKISRTTQIDESILSKSFMPSFTHVYTKKSKQYTVVKHSSSLFATDIHYLNISTIAISSTQRINASLSYSSETTLSQSNLTYYGFGNKMAVSNMMSTFCFILAIVF